MEIICFCLYIFFCLLTLSLIPFIGHSEYEVLEVRKVKLVWSAIEAVFTDLKQGSYINPQCQVCQ